MQESKVKVIRRTYHLAPLEKHLNDLDEVIRGAAVDYHRVCIYESYREVLARFLLRRTPKRARR